MDVDGRVKDKHGGRSARQRRPPDELLARPERELRQALLGLAPAKKRPKVNIQDRGRARAALRCA